jgi:hypothetical protein
MSKYFRPWNIDQTLLLPPSVQDFVPKGHVSRFIVGLVRESLDLKEITGSYVSGLGQPPFEPRMMVALLLHGYASGLYSSRRIEGLPRAERFRDDCRARSAGLPNDQRLPQAPFEGSWGVVPAGSEVVRDGRAGQTRPCRIGWHQDQSERVEA